MALRHYHEAETPEAIIARFSVPIPECGCSAWLGKIGTGGYAYVSYREGGKRLTRKAATVALELAGRPRPEGLEVGHRCRTRWCVNPDHLTYQTRSENSLDRAPYRYKPDCPHCGLPKEYMAHWKKPEWRCRMYSSPNHGRELS